MRQARPSYQRKELLVIVFDNDGKMKTIDPQGLAAQKRSPGRLRSWNRKTECLRLRTD